MVKVLPVDGFKTLTISEDVYELLDQLYMRRRLSRKAKSRSQIVEEAILAYARAHAPDLYTEWLKRQTEKASTK
jgi:predicted CopG family antitoxin